MIWSFWNTCRFIRAKTKVFWGGWIFLFPFWDKHTFITFFSPHFSHSVNNSIILPWFGKWPTISKSSYINPTFFMPKKNLWSFPTEPSHTEQQPFLRIKTKNITFNTLIPPLSYHLILQPHPSHFVYAVCQTVIFTFVKTILGMVGEL